MKNPKVLILTTNYGNGHLQVARALEEQLALVKNVDVVARDVYQETNPHLHEWTKKLYLKSYTKSGRHLYRLFYYSSQQMSKRKQLPIFSYGFSKLSKIIDEEQPDVIVNTFPTLMLPHFIMKANTSIPIYNVITDYCLHHSWLHPHIEKFCVATQQLKAELIANGINKNKIMVTGIPIQRQFEQIYCREDLFKKYQLNPSLKTILIVAGAYGVSKEMENICECLKAEEYLQIIIICGKNKPLYEQMKNKFIQEKHIRVFGYVTRMAEMFQLATCIVTKPGGIILSEAISQNVPIILPQATPGQEKENAQFFESQGAAIYFEKWKHLVQETRQLVRDEAQLIKMKDSIANLHVPNAAETIINDVMQTCYRRIKQNTI